MLYNMEYSMLYNISHILYNMLCEPAAGAAGRRRGGGGGDGGAAAAAAEYQVEMRGA
jgi:hypothetical protein